MDHSSDMLGCGRVDEVGNGVLGGTHDGELGAGLGERAPIGSSVGSAPATKVRTRPESVRGAIHRRTLGAL